MKKRSIVATLALRVAGAAAPSPEARLVSGSKPFENLYVQNSGLKK